MTPGAFSESAPRPRRSKERVRDPLAEAMRESGAVVLDAGQDVSADVALERFAAFPPNIQITIAQVAERAHTYLAKPIIADTFEDQQLRREWRSTIREKYSPEVADFFESNRLRSNALQPLLFKIPGLRAALAKEPSTPESEELIRLLDAFLEPIGEPASFGPRYTPMSLDEKVAIVRSLSDAMRAYLAYVGERQPLAEAA